MEEKKLDLNSIIGFVLIFGILIWIMYQNQPTEAQIKADKAKKRTSGCSSQKTSCRCGSSCTGFGSESASLSCVRKFCLLGQFAFCQRHGNNNRKRVYPYSGGQQRWSNCVGYTQKSRALQKRVKAIGYFDRKK